MEARSRLGMLLVSFGSVISIKKKRPTFWQRWFLQLWQEHGCNAWWKVLSRNIVIAALDDFAPKRKDALDGWRDRQNNNRNGIEKRRRESTRRIKWNTIKSLPRWWILSRKNLRSESAYISHIMYLKVSRRSRIQVQSPLVNFHSTDFVFPLQSLTSRVKQ